MEEEKTQEDTETVTDSNLLVSGEKKQETDRQTDRLRDRETGRQTERQSERAETEEGKVGGRKLKQR